VKAARFPATTTLENFDFSFNTSISKKTIMVLMSTAFITKQQNILLVGPPGVGKTHISLAIGYAAVCNGYSVFTEAPSTWWPIWPRPIEIAPVKNWVSKLVGYNLLIIDEFGMKACRKMQRTICLKSFIEGIKQHQQLLLPIVP